MEEKITGKRFLAVTLLNVLITIVEIIGGLVSGSLALLSDAFHNMGIPSRSSSATLPSTSGAGPKPGSEPMATGGRKSSRPSPTASC